MKEYRKFDGSLDVLNVLAQDGWELQHVERYIGEEKESLGAGEIYEYSPGWYQYDRFFHSYTAIKGLLVRETGK